MEFNVPFTKGDKEKEEALEVEKINITDFDAHIMQQANREQNPAYSITTATDTAHDIFTHFQVNPQDDDGAALFGAIEGNRKNSGQRHCKFQEEIDP